MKDWKVSTNDLGTTVGWLAGLVLIIVGMVTDYETGDLGLLCAGVGGVLNIRRFLMCNEERERNAFALGRDLGQSEREAEVTRLHG